MSIQLTDDEAFQLLEMAMWESCIYHRWEPVDVGREFPVGADVFTDCDTWNEQVELLARKLGLDPVALEVPEDDRRYHEELVTRVAQLRLLLADYEERIRNAAE